MTTVELIKTDFEFLKIISWAIENTKGDWGTISTRSSYYKQVNAFTKEKWGNVIQQMQDILPQFYNKLDNSQQVQGIFKFENPQDAMMFKLIWG